MAKGAGESAEKVVKDIRRKTRRRFSAEEKIRIVLEGLRGEESIATLCRREGIVTNLYYRWSKEFLEAGKKQLQGDTRREATSECRAERRDHSPLIWMRLLSPTETLFRFSEDPFPRALLGHSPQTRTVVRFHGVASPGSAPESGIDLACFLIRGLTCKEPLRADRWEVRHATMDSLTGNR